MSDATPTNEAIARKGRRTLLLIALVAVAPVVASYAAYYWFPRERHVNYGELLARPAPDVSGAYLDGRPFRLADLRGKWVVAAAAPAACGGDCAKALYATRQARTMQGREMERIVRLWLVTDDAMPDAALLAEHPDLAVVRVAPAAVAAWGVGADRIVAVDPLGNLVLAYPRDPDIKGVARDLTRLLKASRIG